MAQTKQKIWTPIQYEVNIGSGTYVIGPAPIERLIEFDSVVKGLTEGLDGLEDKFFVRDEQFDSLESAQAFIDANGLETEVRVEGVSLRDILEKLVSAPYPALRLMIPDLKEEHVREAPLPNLKHVLDVIIEVNGVEWFERFLKNSLGPLLPQLLGAGVEAAKKALQNFTAPNASSGETA
jgi:hypothetical protein